MAVLALIQEEVRVQAYVWVVAVHIIQPDGMVYDLPWFLTTDLAHTTIDGQPIINECLAHTSPRLALVELLLIQTHHILSCDPATHASGLCYTGI